MAAAPDDPGLALARRTAQAYGQHQHVVAVALGEGGCGPPADVTLLVYVTKRLPFSARAQVAQADARYAELGGWPGISRDEWIDRATGLTVAAVFRRTAWIEAELGHILERHRARQGATTVHWYDVLHARRLLDRTGWLGQLQESADRPYPPELARAIKDTNYPALRDRRSAFLPALEAAAARGDWPAALDRANALLASYFDVLFAVNHVAHPRGGDLVDRARRLCRYVPAEFGGTVEAFLGEIRPGGDPAGPGSMLIDGLESAMATSAGLLTE